MANIFPTASTVIRRLKSLGIEAAPAWQYSGTPGYYVANGLTHTNGPVILVQGDNKEWLTRELAILLERNYWNVNTRENPIRIRINSIPKDVGRSDTTMTTTAMQHSQSREADYRQKSAAAWAAGRYLDSSRWSRLAEYERDRAQRSAT